MNWFTVAILPVLQDFAESTASILEIETQSQTHITATIKNGNGLEITENCKIMRSLLILADHISIALEDDIILLSLDYISNCF